MKLSLEGKNALVCGGSKGIGGAIGRVFASAGANVTLLSRNFENLKNAFEKLDANRGQKHDFVAVNLDDPEHAKSKIEGKIKSGKIWHILVNNSGGPAPGMIVDEDAEKFLSAFKRHLIASQLITKALLPGMISEKFGRIINVISISVKQPIAGLGVSNTIRGAMNSWSKTLASEVGPFGITVNNILPGQTRTERLESLIADTAKKRGVSIEQVESEMIEKIPVGRFADPTETAYAAAFLASEQAAFINGVNLPVDGGFYRGL